jgi:hypothetical protein
MIVVLMGDTLWIASIFIKMTYSHVQPKGWGFSHKPSVFEYSIFGDATGQTKIGDWS